MLQALESSAKVLAGLQSMTALMQAVNTIIVEPTKATEQSQLLDNLLQACHNGEQWLKSVSDHVHLLKQNQQNQSPQSIMPADINT